MSLIEKIFIAFIVLIFPTGEILRLSPAASVYTNLIDISVFGIILIWGIRKIIKREKLKGALKINIALILLIMFFSLFFNLLNFQFNQILTSSLYLVRWIFYAMIYFLVLDTSKKFKESMPFYLIVSGLLILILGFIQYAFYPSLRNLYYLEWDEHLYRMFSVYLDPNFASVIFTLIFLLSLEKVIKTKERLRIFYASVSGLSVLAIFLTYSRTGLVALILSLIFFLFMIGRKKIILAIILSVVIVLILLPKSFETEGTNLFRSASITARLESMSNALILFKENPFFGVGYNTYRFAQHERGLNLGERWQVSHGASGVENSYLHILSTMGIAGFSTFVWFFLRLLRTDSKNKTRKAIYLSSLIAIMVSAFFVNSLFYGPILIWLWTLTGITENT